MEFRYVLSSACDISRVYDYLVDMMKKGKKIDNTFRVYPPCSLNFQVNKTYIDVELVTNKISSIYVKIYNHFSGIDYTNNRALLPSEIFEDIECELGLREKCTNSLINSRCSNLPKYILFTEARGVHKNDFIKQMLNSEYDANCKKYTYDDITSSLDEIYHLSALNHSKGEKTMKIRSILANDSKKITTVVFEDGDVQMVKCNKEDEFDENIGVALCIAQHLFGSKTQFHKFVKKTVKGVKYELGSEAETKKEEL